MSKSVERFVMQAAIDSVANRWGIKHEDMNKIVGDFDAGSEETFNNRAAQVVGLSIGLGQLFGECADAEKDWVWKRHPGLDGNNPLSEMLCSRSGLPAVLDVLNVERNLR